MKVGDLIMCGFGYPDKPQRPKKIGTVLDFPPAIHHKEFQKVKVMTEDGLIENWIMQFCKVISEYE